MQSGLNLFRPISISQVKKQVKNAYEKRAKKRAFVKKLFQ
ncbi:hypothetical protein VST7929_01315 [Vibrio stylophorae]|uniref:Uncharacterized protein n=1 Tax=Vibrio stylophorae TaxID=659351 RepID=A0ABN8DS03_9VIBR|nr:hypothetical protein VST7929_01315 [Vibrio stylophorae]